MIPQGYSFIELMIAKRENSTKIHRISEIGTQKNFPRILFY